MHGQQWHVTLDVHTDFSYDDFNSVVMWVGVILVVKNFNTSEN